MISNGKIAYDGSFNGLREITGNLTRFIITMENDLAPDLVKGILLKSQKRVYEFEVDLSKVPIKSLLAQLSQMDGVKDVEINNVPIEQVISELYKSWIAQST